MAFTGYAYAIASAKRPAYPGKVKAVLAWIIEEMCHERVWKYRFLFSSEISGSRSPSSVGSRALTVRIETYEPRRDAIQALVVTALE